MPLSALLVGVDEIPNKHFPHSYEEASLPGFNRGPVIFKFFPIPPTTMYNVNCSAGTSYYHSNQHCRVTYILYVYAYIYVCTYQPGIYVDSTGCSNPRKPHPFVQTTFVLDFAMYFVGHTCLVSIRKNTLPPCDITVSYIATVSEMLCSNVMC